MIIYICWSRRNIFLSFFICCEGHGTGGGFISRRRRKWCYDCLDQMGGTNFSECKSAALLNKKSIPRIQSHAQTSDEFTEATTNPVGPCICLASWQKENGSGAPAPCMWSRLQDRKVPPTDNKVSRKPQKHHLCCFGFFST
ncbi:unnamed protein product [Musa textilis]